MHQRRVGGPLEQLYYKWGLAAIRKRLAYQYFTAESCFSGSETFSKTIEAKNRAGFFRQLNCGLLYQQGRRHLFEMCALMWRILAWSNAREIHIRARHIPGNLNVIANSLSRRVKAIQTKWSLHPLVFRQICQVWHKPMVDLFATSLNAKLPTYVSPVPDNKAWQIDTLNISWEGLDAYTFCPVAILPQLVQKMVAYRCSHCDSTRVAGDALVLGSGGIVNQDSSEASSSAQSPKATLQSQIPQESGVSESSCMVSGLLQEGQGGFSVEVVDRIKAPQRECSRRVYDSRWVIFQKWAQENQVDFTKPSIPQVAEFLNHLFTDKNLKPRTIAGYRTSVADGLGSAGQMVSQSLDLNCLIASFHRDRPSANRSIPNWDLSQVLLALTRPPFEPLAKADLKILTFKTVFLLALASGKRRSEIHAWTFDSFSRKWDWSEVTFSPSTAFIAKNQLALEGPLAIQPVVIPAL